MNNLEVKNGIVNTKGLCTMCYRCISNCPKQAITLLGKKVYEQCKIEKYIDSETYR
jgi:ferredoxin